MPTGTVCVVPVATETAAAMLNMQSYAAVINAAYAPTSEELAHVQRAVSAFAANSEAGTPSIDGLMVDRPHLTQALHTPAQTD